MRAVQNLRSQNFVHGPHWAKKLDLTGQKNWTRSTHLNLNLDQPPSKLTANFANRTTICFNKHVGRTIGFCSSVRSLGGGCEKEKKHSFRRQSQDSQRGNKKNVGKVIKGSAKNIVSAGNPQDSPTDKIKYGRQ